jgi:hypothetical protein
LRVIRGLATDVTVNATERGTTIRMRWLRD